MATVGEVVSFPATASGAARFLARRFGLDEATAHAIVNALFHEFIGPMVMDHGVDVQLAENLWLRRVVYMGGRRLEVINGASHRVALKALGAWVEVANFTPRVFLPTDRPEALAAVVRRWPATQILTRGRAAA